ncbi:hypothetical protein HBI56_039690 [Parastagonospora nodorum]|nr:hypothetical protein HBI56_039690 [Parastagonospora nodorum]
MAQICVTMEGEDTLDATQADITSPETAHRLPVFFVLPRELRDMVYNELWKVSAPMTLMVLIKEATPTHHLVIRYEDCAAKPANSSRSELKQCLHSGLPQWLLSNKAFLDEGLNQLFRKATWMVNSQQWRTPCSKEIVRNTKAGIITARSLIIVIDITNSGLGLDAVQKIKHKLIFPGTRSAHAEFMGTPMPHLTSLHIKLEYSWIIHLDHKYTLDLSCIETTLHLKRFSISISMDRDMDSKLLRPIIDKEACRLGCSFVGVDHHIDIEENVCDWSPVEGLAPRSGLFVAWTFVRNEKG